MSDGKMTHDRAVFLGGLANWSASQAKEVKFEMARARGSEEAMAEQLRQKDETIAALANALAFMRSEVDMGLITRKTAFAVTAALVKAKRKP